MDSTSESDDDYEEQMQDLAKLSAAIDDEPTILDTNSTKSGSESVLLWSRKKQLELSRIESALALNKLMEEKYKRLEKILSLRLRECRKKLSENVKDMLQNTPKNEAFRYYSCGKPYFKDKASIAAPDNDDTILMRKSEMYDFSSVLSVPGWTVRDKSLLINTLHEMSQALRKTELSSQITRMRRENANKKDIEKLQKELSNVKKKSLAELALPIDQEYDWDHVAYVLHNRHSAQEYQALWKLFFHPSINKSSWTRKEHQNLQEIAVQNDQQDWDAIAEKLNTGRTGYQCFVYFRTNMINETTGKKWSKDEVEYLRRLVVYFREDNYIPWGKVASAFEHRTKIQVYNKYTRLVEQRKGRFLAEEDSVILNCVANFGLNFRKMTKFLPGRSSVQLRTRYNLLTKMRISTTWSIDDDKKLLQIMANQDSAAYYSTATKHFPGKDRVNIRTRYNTLKRWMKMNPNTDISLAPRRGARRLLHGKPNDDLCKSVENLKNRMQNEVNKSKSNRINKHSTEVDIEEGIMQIIYKELLNQEVEKKQQQKIQRNRMLKFDNFNIEGAEGEININNLKSVLIFLNAKLNKDMFLKSKFLQMYSELAELNEEPNHVKVKSYSRKQTVAIFQLNDRPDIWGHKPLGKGKYVLPPNLATITGCRVLMNHISKKFSIPRDEVNISLMARRNDDLRHCLTALKLRFTELFTWPILLSNASPSDEKKLPKGIACCPLNMHLQPTKQVEAGPSMVNEPINDSMETDSDSPEDMAVISDFSSTDEDDL